MAAGPVFPGFIRVEYKTDGSSKSKFLAEAAQLSGEIKKPFSEAFDQIGKMVDRVSGKLKDGNFALDVDTSSLRQAANQADFTAKKMAALRDAALQISSANRDQSESTLAFTKALQAQAAEAERISQTSRDQLAAYTNLEKAVAGLTRENQALAQSYRDTYLEQAKTANAAYEAQKKFNALAGVKRPEDAASRNGAPTGASRSAFAEQGGLTPGFNQAYTDTRNMVEKYIQGRQALEGMAEVSGTLETVLGRVANRSKDVADALRRAKLEAEKVKPATPANAAPQSQLFGKDAFFAGQASLDKAAISGVSLERVLGRVAGKSREVTAALRDAERAADEAAKTRAANEAKVAAEMDRVKRQLAEQVDLALSLKRNSAGALDLGVKDMQAAATAQQARAVAARELAVATATAAREQNDMTAATQAAIAASARLADEEEQAAAAAKAQALAVEQLQERLNRQASATDLVVGATRRGTSESGNVINSLRAQRVAFTQLGQQLTDVTVQMQMGTSATTIFVQQVPQMAFALSGLTESTNKFYRGIGAVGSFLAGPWGAAVFAATAVLGPYIANLLSGADAAEEAEKASRRLGDGIDFASMAAMDLTKSIIELEAAQRKQIQTSYQAEAASLADAEAALKAARAQRERAKATLQGYLISQQRNAGQGTGGVAGSAGGLLALQTEKQIADLEKANATAEKLVRETRIPIERRAATAATDAAAAATLKYDKAVGTLNKRYADGKISLDEYRNSLRGVEAQKEKDEAAARKRTRRGPDPAKEAERAARAAARLNELGEDYGKRIANVRDSFADIPPEVERVAKATRELDDIISDLNTNRPKNFEDMVKQAEALKKQLPDLGIQRAMRQITEDARQQVQYQMLILQGRDGEAQALQIIAQKEEQFGKLTQERKDEIIATGIALQRINEHMQRAQEIQGVFLESTRSVRAEVEGILGGYGSLANLASVLRRQFQQIQGKIFTEQIFGDLFRDMDRYVKEKTGIGSSVDMLAKETERAGTAAGEFAEAITAATGRIMGGGSGAGGIVAGASAVTAWGNLKIPDSIRNPAYDGDPNGPIVVAAKKATAGRTINDLRPEEYFQRFSQAFGSKFAGLLEPLLGKKLAGNIGGVIGGIFEGKATTGTGFGAILGGLKEIKGIPQGITEGLGKAFKGAQTGAAVAGLGNALGIKMSNTGAQIGGALGKFIPIPGGEIIGSIAGGLLGNLFGKKVTSGYAQVRNGSVVGTYGRTKDLQNDASEAAGGLVDTIASLAKTLNVRLGAYDFDYGKKDNKFVVNTGARGVFNFDNEQQAMEFAVREAVADGAFIGIKDAQKRLLMASGDLQAQAEKAVKFGDVFKQLKAIKDPVGAALDDLNSQFSDLIDIFKEAGASAEDLASLEELYGLKRKDAIKQAMESAIGPLKSLMQNITVGSDFYSLRDRQASAQAIYNPLAERVKSGDMTAYAEFSDAAQSLIDINRQLYGSTSPFYDFLDSVKALTNGALTSEQAKIDAANVSDSPFKDLATQQQATTSAIDNQTQRLIEALGGRLDTLNDNLINAIRSSVASGSASNVTSLLSAGGAW